MNNFSIHFRILSLAGFIFYALFGNTPAISAKQSMSNIEARPSLSTTLYDTGSPSLTDIWVDPVNGNNANDGTSPASAFRTLSHAWGQIPQTDPLTQGYRVNLQPGTYAALDMPNYWDNRHGTLFAPVWFKGNGSRAQIILQGDINLYGSEYIYFENLSIIRSGDAFHCELCDHILLRNVALNGGGTAQETIKVNQSQYFYIENSSLSNAYENVIDFVAVQYSHIVNNRIFGGGDWCAYVKGGSAYILVESNVIYNCGTGGFTAGQGTGFQYMTQPWIQYEAYDIKFVNNVIHDTQGAGIGVNGGYNILMAHNTMYRVGSISHVIEAVFGMRSCDGQIGNPERVRCQANLDAGGWGTTLVDDGTNHIHIPNKNVFIYNNIVYNPAGFQSAWQHFAVYEPRANLNNTSNAGPNPAKADDNLQIKGNIIWNGSTSMPLGIEGTEACANSNPTCNEAQLLADNEINTVQPQFLSPAAENFHPTGSWMTSVAPAAIPDFSWDLAGVAAGNDSNAVASDFENADRSAGNVVGAYIVTYIPTQASFRSIAAQDGWILESAESSNQGGALNRTSEVFQLGDDAADRQYRAVLSFNTGAFLPDDAVVTKVTLKVRRTGVIGGGNPLTALQGFRADVKKGFFGTTTLVASDFQTAANLTVGPTTPPLLNNWYALNLSGAARYINAAGLTQIRLRFNRDDNDNRLANFIRFYSGDATVALNRPQLIVQYYTP